MKRAMNVVGGGGVALVLALAGMASSASAAVIYTAVAPGTTSALNAGGGNSDGTGIWFNPRTGYVENRGFFFPSPLFDDGQYFLWHGGAFNSANIFVQGFFSRGNGVIYTSNTNLNPARFADGDFIGPGIGFHSPGAGFSDLGPTFGNWPTGGRGFLGLVFRDPTGTSDTDVFYGYADITINPTTFAITLNGFAYNSVRGQGLTIPTPAATLPLALAGVVSLRRRRR
jgi:hypothetical protein